MDNGPDAEPEKDASIAAPPASSRTSTPTHKRSLSGNILSRLSFLRSVSSDEKSLNHGIATANDQDHADQTREQTSSRTTTTDTQGSLKGRPRNTSLRKTALLGGTGRRKSLPLQRKTSTKQHQQSQQSSASLTAARHEAISANSESPPMRRSFSYEDVDHNASSSDSAWSPKPVGLTLVTDHHATKQHSSPPLVLPVMPPSTSPSVTSPASQSYASTTDDDDVLSFGRRQLAVPPSVLQSSAAMGYYAAQQPLARRRSNKQPPASPLTALPLDAYSPIEEVVDYSNTEWWGWVVLIVTWFTFVVGMGSCFGVWSWAWDVGQTPYAPPELEDDPTLPIVGYYPALITLTAVMAWVWVVVAWVGIKYFKHAKIQGEDT